MNTFVVLSALISLAAAIPSKGYYSDGGYGDGGSYKGAILLADNKGYGGGYGDGGYGGGYGNSKQISYTTTRIVKVPVLTKSVEYRQEEPIRQSSLERHHSITPIYGKTLIKPVITKTYQPVITKSYEISEPKTLISYGGSSYDDGSYKGGYDGGNDDGSYKGGYEGQYVSGGYDDGSYKGGYSDGGYGNGGDLKIISYGKKY
ncbi:chorion protein S18-like [Oppia nitens]|uniref:chorion protein S18-like n=1 Tax=Oppia nitens TaxID=1686743 RepID=UPI0023D9FFAE|nr:chorion protein S18-like [Oppia nitens]